MHRRFLVITLLGLIGVPELAGAQHDPLVATAQGTRTRAELRELASSAERLHADESLPAATRESKRAEAWLARYRLEHGDFRVGDRIALRVIGQEAMSDTFVVRSDLRLELPELPAISLAGVLRVELDSVLTAEVGRFLRAPRLHATPLLRVAVTGQVARPGFYTVPADVLLSDVLMSAGGPAPDADLGRTTVARGSEVVWREHQVAVALADGASLDLLGLRGGDEIRVGERSRRSWQDLLQVTGAIAGLAVAILGISRM